jgi:hypothetical protein
MNSLWHKSLVTPWGLLLAPPPSDPKPPRIFTQRGRAIVDALSAWNTYHENYMWHTDGYDVRQSNGNLGTVLHIPLGLYDPRASQIEVQHLYQTVDSLSSAAGTVLGEEIGCLQDILLGILEKESTDEVD